MPQGDVDAIGGVAVARYRVGIETRARIVDATREVLAEVGPAEATLKAITERAGVGAGSFYNLFDSKEAAVLEVVRDAIAAVDPDPAGQGEETVDALVEAFVRFFVDERTAVAARIYLQYLLAGALTDEVLAVRVARHHAARVARFEGALRRDDPALDRQQGRRLAEQLLAALAGAATVWLLDPRIALPELVTELRSAIMR